MFLTIINFLLINTIINLNRWHKYSQTYSNILFKHIKRRVNINLLYTYSKKDF